MLFNTGVEHGQEGPKDTEQTIRRIERLLNLWCMHEKFMEVSIQRTNRWSMLPTALFVARVFT